MSLAHVDTYCPLQNKDKDKDKDSASSAHHQCNISASSTHHQNGPDQDREDFNLADLILELAFLFPSNQEDTIRKHNSENTEKFSKGKNLIFSSWR